MGTVSVALRLPFGLVIEHKGAKHLLNGWNQGATQMSVNREGFGITDGVDADLFNGWYGESAAAGVDLVTKDLVFAADTPQAARDQARERELNVASGLEGLNAENPMPGLTGPDGKPVAIEPTDETRQTIVKNRTDHPPKKG
jgi:hypothetical protein